MAAHEAVVYRFCGGTSGNPKDSWLCSLRTCLPSVNRLNAGASLFLSKHGSVFVRSRLELEGAKVVFLFLGIEPQLRRSAGPAFILRVCLKSRIEPAFKPD